MVDVISVELYIRILVPLNSYGHNPRLVSFAYSWSALSIRGFELGCLWRLPCEWSIAMLAFETKVITLTWWGSLESGVPTQDSSSSLERGSKL
ncbi:hypothetical protein TNCV_4432461 [Trichonephila clavipes]|nr:hypothetical protein TNCV_4432461 [Trichonephila clavipes]